MKPALSLNVVVRKQRNDHVGGEKQQTASEMEKSLMKSKVVASASILKKRWQQSCKSVIRRKKPTQAKQNSTFRFLDLPSEVRLLVYEAILVKQLPYSCPRDNVIEVCGDSFWDRPPFGDYYTWTHPILRSCSQIRTEALDIFFTSNTFAFCDESNMRLFLNVVGDFGRSRIRSVKLCSMPHLWRHEETYSAQDWRIIENYLRMTARLTDLRHLMVTRSPLCFQQMDYDDLDSDYDEPTWIPDVDTLDIDDVLKSAYIGFLLQFRGLKSFRIDWAFFPPTFSAKQMDWFKALEHEVAQRVVASKPAKYHERGDFIWKGYDDELRAFMFWWFRWHVSHFFYPTWARKALGGKPSDYFSTFAFDREKWDHDHRWQERAKIFMEHASNAWYYTRHPKYYVRNRMRRSSHVTINWEDYVQPDVQAAGALDSLDVVDLDTGMPAWFQEIDASALE